MALNLTALPDYVSHKSKEFIRDAVLGAQTIKLLQAAGSVQVGVKSEAAINLLTPSINVQSDLDCARNPIGDTNIGQVIIKVHPLKDEQNFCPKKYENKWTSDYLTKGSTYSELLFAQEIMQARAEKIAEFNENHIWQGNTTGNTAYNKYDGFVKLVKASAAQAITTSGSTMDAKLKSVFLAAPIVVTADKDARMFVGQDTYNQYLADIDAKNFYQPIGDTQLRATTMKLEPVAGLNGTGFVLVANTNQLVYGTDMTGEEDTATLDYSLETKQIYMDFHWKSGVQIVRTSQMAYAQL